MVDTAMDIMAEKRGPLKQNQKQKPAQMLVMDTHMVDTDMDIMAEKSDLLRLKLNQKLMLVPMLGMGMEVTEVTVMEDIHTDMDMVVLMDTVVTATHFDTTDSTVKCHVIETVPAKTTLPSSLKEIQ